MIDLILGLCALALAYIIYNILTTRKLPPGPFRIPIFGNLIQLAKADPVPYIALHKLSLKYACDGVMSLKIGSTNTVVVSTYEALKETSMKYETTGRDVTRMFAFRSFNSKGIIFAEGEHSKSMRAFTISNLKPFGFGQRNSTESIINCELTDFLEYFQSIVGEKDGIVEFSFLFNLTALNIMWSLIGGEQLGYNDEMLLHILDTIDRYKKSGVFGTGLAVAFPFLRYLAPKVTGHTIQRECDEAFHRFFKKLLEEKRENFKETRKINCFIDALLQKMEEESDDPNTIFTDDNFVVTIMDLFQAGSETTSSQLSYAFLIMVARPEIQKRIQEEIFNTVGKRAPQLDDLPKMHFVQATISEVFRWSRTVINLVPRRVMADFQYKGFTIKKDTEIIPNMHSIHFDVSVWGDDANIFCPERFLDKNGFLDRNIVERLVAFGLGRRACIGERVARDTFSLYFTTIMQKYTLEIVPGEPITTIEPVIGFLLGVPEFRAFVKRRC